MKKFFSQLVLFALIPIFALILMTASTAFAKESPEEQRAKLDEMSGQVLQLHLVVFLHMLILQPNLTK